MLIFCLKASSGMLHGVSLGGAPAAYAVILLVSVGMMQAMADGKGRGD